MPHKDIEIGKEYQRRYRQRHKEEIMERQRKWRGENREHYLEWHRIYRQKNRWKRLSYGWVKKIEALCHYSSSTAPICAHCGETDVRVLQIDHIDGGGYRHTVKIGKVARIAGNSFYRWLQREGFPVGYQVLCANCNIRKRYSDDSLYCPEGFR